MYTEASDLSSGTSKLVLKMKSLIWNSLSRLWWLESFKDLSVSASEAPVLHVHATKPSPLICGAGPNPATYACAVSTLLHKPSLQQPDPHPTPAVSIGCMPVHLLAFMTIY